MIYFLIGHRGAGKTSILSRVQQYFSEANEKITAVDLDRLIEESSAQSVSQIFAAEGEKGFRARELATFRSFLKQHSFEENKSHTVFLSVGAGFPLTELQCGSSIWIRRPTDSQGRIFLDRPRLDSEVSALEEYLQRFESREKAYAEKADWVWSVLEGWDHPNEFERDFFIKSFSTQKQEPLKICSTLTLFENLNGLSKRLQNLLQIRGLSFEVRDDLLSRDQQKEAMQIIPRERLLYSFRAPNVTRQKVSSVVEQSIAWDWPCELGILKDFHPSAVPTWISLHERRMHLGEQESVTECIHRLSGMRDEMGASTQKMKLAIEIHTFSELQEGHRWVLQDPAYRSFLPRTPTTAIGGARWNWYRLWTLPGASLSFVREGQGSSLDQPDFAQALQRLALPNANWFSAVLGDPVLHSRTPSEQFKFFREREMPVFAIPLGREDWCVEPEGQEALTVLREMGLRAAAVTAPLKLLAGSANTLYWSDCEGSWLRTNTDGAGFKKLFDHFRQESQIAVWGGGGTLEVIRAHLPQARFFSARTGEDKSPSQLTQDARWCPRMLVWAAGNSAPSLAFGPPSHWRPERILDLSYTEGSKGREYALSIGAEYTSGLAMFEEQARGQREFWGEFISEDGHGRKFIR